MKKSIALVLVTIMLLSIAAVAFAACNHSWYTVSTTTKSIKEYIYKSSCTKLSNPHSHWRYRYETSSFYVCSKGCGATKQGTPYISGYSKEHCPKD